MTDSNVLGVVSCDNCGASSTPDIFTCPSCGESKTLVEVTYQAQGTTALNCTCPNAARYPHGQKNCIRYRCGHDHMEYAIIEIGG